jgi:CHAT domain-containing protein
MIFGITGIRHSSAPSRFFALSAIFGLLSISGLAEDARSEAAQGTIAVQQGAFDEAATHWERALQRSRKEKDKTADIDASVNLASAYQALGQQSRAVELLAEALVLAKKFGGTERIIRVQERLAMAQAFTRNGDEAENLLRESLDSARTNQLRALEPAILNDLGNVLAARQKTGEALEDFKASARVARENGDRQLLATALSNAAATAARGSNEQQGDKLNSQAIEAINALQPSHEKVFLLLKTGETDQQLKTDGDRTRFLRRAHDSAAQALKISEAIQDRAGTSYAVGTLGHLYETDKQLDAALSLTRRAIFAAQEGQLPDALYRWQWQVGRILRAQGKTDEAIASYRRAVQTLQPIRHDIALGYGNAQTQQSFRESLGPLFYELADLLLADSEKEKDQEQTLLREARETVEQLKAVELEDYFRDECVNTVRAKTESLEKVDARSAVMYLIPLPNRTEILVGLSSGLRRFRADINSSDLIAEVREFRRNLETRTTYQYLEQAQHLYDLIIRPVHSLLTENQIETIVFVPDGALQTIPLAALHDGKKFLVEEFAVTVTPGLSVVEPRPLERKHAQVLLSGLSDAVQGFSALDFVPEEIKDVENEYRGEVLLNNSFKTAALEKKMSGEQFSIVHIASHGKFDRDSRKTFVLTYDDKLTLNDLESVIRPSQYRGKPVELLVLSACQTAAGDDRAALGLAGVAVKAGARSAVASLWFVNDQSTAAFVSELYNQLRQAPAVSRAKAVQAAQVKMLRDRRFRHPCYWAPYLLIGNWL